MREFQEFQEFQADATGNLLAAQHHASVLWILDLDACSLQVLAASPNTTPAGGMAAMMAKLPATPVDRPHASCQLPAARIQSTSHFVWAGTPHCSCERGQHEHKFALANNGAAGDRICAKEEAWDEHHADKGKKPD